ncbi:MAG: iron export ABC transporter permease subunit FetB [Sandaracinaceae bacterium]
MSAAPIDLVQLALGAVFVLVAGLVSLVMRLGLEKQLAIASARTVLQLGAVGYVLGWVFALGSPYVVGAVLLVMVIAAAWASVSRSSRAYPRARSTAFAVLLVVSLTTTLGATRLIVGAEGWFTPQYVIPLLGMVLGNALTGISLCLDELLRALDEGRAKVETELALGATRWEAARGPLREAVRRGMIPMINAMMVVGLVSLPGMMTGQILEGADPQQAVRYQILVMFMLAGASALGSTLLAWLTYRQLFNDRHQLLVERIVARRE